MCYHRGVDYLSIDKPIYLIIIKWVTGWWMGCSSAAAAAQANQSTILWRESLSMIYIYDDDY